MKRILPAPVVLVLTALAAAQSDQLPSGSLQASDGAFADLFGQDVALRGNVALVSATANAPSGSAYVFREQGGVWQEAQILTPSDGQSGDAFGWGLALGPGVAFCGAYLHDTAVLTEGAVYVFEEVAGAFTETQKLVSPDPDPSDYFGLSLDSDGTTLVVGCPRDVQAQGLVGCAFVYEEVGGTWAEVQKLVPLDPASQKELGWSVAIDGDVAVLGAPGDSFTRKGAAYVFRRVGGTFVQEQKLVASNGASNDRLGISVAVHGDTILVGAEHTSDAGAVYVFRDTGSGWVEEAFLQPADSLPDQLFGLSLDVDGAGNAVIGRPDIYGFNIGDVHVYRRSATGWLASIRLVSTSLAFDALGRMVCIDGGRILAGAPKGNFNKGIGYLYALPEIVLGANDTTVLAGQQLTLGMTGGKPLAPALLAVFAVQGSPLWQTLRVGAYNALGEFTLGGPVPAGFAGLHIDFLGMGTAPSGPIQFSNVLGVDFQ